MGYSLKFRLRKAIAEQCDEWFSGYENIDVVIDYFDNSKDDPKTWLTYFCCWARQEELPDYFKLDCAIVAMNHTHAFPAETSEDGGTWDEFVHVFKEKFMGDCKCWAGIHSSSSSLSCLLETVVEISLQSHRYIFSALFLFFSVEH
jgi:hypothetical protein